VVEAAALLSITYKLLYNWVSKVKKDNVEGALSGDGRAELNKLKKEKNVFRWNAKH
jgi:hypothetical protein